MHGVVSLHVGRLLDLGLVIAPDESDPSKVLITNLPYENPGTAEGEKLAGDVARMARVIPMTIIVAKASPNGHD